VDFKDLAAGFSADLLIALAKHQLRCVCRPEARSLTSLHTGACMLHSSLLRSLLSDSRFIPKQPTCPPAALISQAPIGFWGLGSVTQIACPYPARP
jgi:hypothetical protein